MSLYRVCEINRIYNWCSMGTGKSQPKSPTIPLGKEACRVSNWTVEPRVGIFLFPHKTPLMDFFLTFQLAMYCIIFVGDVTVDVYKGAH